MKNSFSWATLGALAVTVLYVAPACEDPETTDETVAALLQQVPVVVEPALTQVVVEAEVLDDAVAAYAAAAPDDRALALADAKQAWRGTMLAWQQVEVMQIGPTASSITALGGEDRRDAIYAWPSTDLCGVDEALVAGGWQAGQDWVDGSLVSVTGLDALEYLLYKGVDNACAPNHPLNADGTWEALGNEEREQLRAAMASVLASAVLHEAETLEARWVGGYSDELASGEGFASQSEALNAVYDALFYIEIATKDLKLASGSEHLDSGIAGPAVVANLQAFRQLFTGGEGIGFDDLLVAHGHESVATTLLTELDEALVAAEAINGPIEPGDPAVEQAYDALSDVTTLLKGHMSVVWFLEVPAAAAGDVA